MERVYFSFFYVETIGLVLIKYSKCILQLVTPLQIFSDTIRRSQLSLKETCQGHFQVYVLWGWELKLDVLLRKCFVSMTI